MLRTLVAILALTIGIVRAQSSISGQSTSVYSAVSSSYTDQPSSTTVEAPSTTQGEITIYTITVGKDGQFQFVPDSITAVPGDIVTFQFYPSNHSVIQSTYGYPCVPIADVSGQDGFYSQFEPVTNGSEYLPTWNLTINDTSPVWYYCGAPGSCIGYGMLGVINPGPGENVSTQQTLAKQADYMIEYGQPLPASISASIAALAATATTATQTITVSANSTSTSATATASTSAAAAASSSSHLSSGAIAGIAVGAAAVALGAAALFFLLGRTKTLKEQVNRSNQPTVPGPETTQSAGGGLFGPDQGNRYSQLPPYQMNSAHEPKAPNEAFAVGAADPVRSHAMSPETPYPDQGQFSPPAQAQRFRYSESSELGGGALPYPASHQSPTIPELDGREGQRGFN